MTYMNSLRISVPELRLRFSIAVFGYPAIGMKSAPLKGPSSASSTSVTCVIAAPLPFLYHTYTSSGDDDCGSGTPQVSEPGARQKDRGGSEQNFRGG